MLMEDRRKFERFDLKVPAKIESVYNEEGVIYDFETSNLSAEGAYLKLGRMLPEGSQVRIEIFLNFDELRSLDDSNGSLIIAAAGSVIRTEHDGIVVHLNKDYDLKARLASLLKEK
jgi:hypothetical protein